MEVTEAIDIGRDAIWVLLKVSLPIMLVSLVVGLTIALFQALTQIQEMTLTFVPKIIAIFLTVIIALPFIFNTLSDFTEDLSRRIVSEHVEESGE